MIVLLVKEAVINWHWMVIQKCKAISVYFDFHCPIEYCIIKQLDNIFCVWNKYNKGAMLKLSHVSYLKVSNLSLVKNTSCID